MALIRWEPFREIDSLQREMNRLFDSLSTSDNGDLNTVAFVPPAEIQETATTIELKIEVPGLDAKDLDVRVTEQAVAISGERQSERQSEGNGMTRSEFRYGKFQRVIPLPTRVQNTQVKADYKNGILNLSLPKAEEEKHKVFKVSLG
ncbi:MAG TPA: Hsp20/alpha crystallin family protein, partial [Coleofasciculaceae cyanobacterium]